MPFEGLLVPAKGIDIAEENAGHIFRDAPGHLPDDTAANRQLLQQTATNPDNYVGTDSNGVATYRETLPNGSQVWAEVWRGQITNGGVRCPSMTAKRFPLLTKSVFEMPILLCIGSLMRTGRGVANEMMA